MINCGIVVYEKTYLDPCRIFISKALNVIFKESYGEWAGRGEPGDKETSDSIRQCGG